MSVALTVDTGGVRGGKIIKKRPVWWIAKEGQDDLRPMFEALERDRGQQTHGAAKGIASAAYRRRLAFSHNWDAAKKRRET
jgi:hypothetical protein